MPSAQRIGLFGGTFDPIHLGHIEMAKTAAESIQLDQVRFIPCQISPHKSESPTSARHRLEMAKLATLELPWALVDEIEVAKDGPSYSWKTAEALRQQFPDASLFWIMGTDQWNSLQKWAHPDRLAKAVEFIVFTRGETPATYAEFTCHTIEFQHPASATEIRNGKSHAEWLHPSVADYISNHQLYAG